MIILKDFLTVSSLPPLLQTPEKENNSCYYWMNSLCVYILLWTMTTVKADFVSFLTAFAFKCSVWGLAHSRYSKCCLLLTVKWIREEEIILLLCFCPYIQILGQLPTLYDKRVAEGLSSPQFQYPSTISTNNGLPSCREVWLYELD